MAYRDYASQLAGLSNGHQEVEIWVIIFFELRLKLLLVVDSRRCYEQATRSDGWGNKSSWICAATS
jgi:hypothetical protein